MENFLKLDQQLQVLECELVRTLWVEYHRDINLCGKQLFWVISMASLPALFETSLPKLLELVSVLFPSEVLLLWELLFCQLEWVPSLLFIVCERQIVYAHEFCVVHVGSLPPVVQPRTFLPLTDCMFFFSD